MCVGSNLLAVAIATPLGVALCVVVLVQVPGGGDSGAGLETS